MTANRVVAALLTLIVWPWFGFLCAWLYLQAVWTWLWEPTRAPDIVEVSAVTTAIAIALAMSSIAAYVIARARGNDRRFALIHAAVALAATPFAYLSYIVIAVVVFDATL